jgi:N-acetylglucosamine-6-sulfatase
MASMVLTHEGPRALPTRTLTIGVAALVAVALTLSLLALRGTNGSQPLQAAAAETAAAPATKPNIVVVMADDMRADDLRFMPSLGRLVTERGLKFRNSFSPYPLCCPARASFLSGQYAHNHKVFSNDAPFGFGSFDDSRTLATALQGAGYRTGFVGKYLNNYGIDRSRVTGEHSWGYVPAGWTDWYAALQRPRRLADRYPSGGTYNYFHTIFNVNGRTDDSHKGEYQTDVLGRFGRELVTRYSRTKEPFFLYLSSLAPHDGLPHEPDDVDSIRRADGRVFEFDTPARPDWVKGFFDDQVPRSPGLPADGGPSEADVSDKPQASFYPELDEGERRLATALTRQRAESIAVLDTQIRRLIHTLKETGELDQTVFVFTSDNGYFLGEHRFRGGKVKAYEPSIRVPLVIAGPGIPPGVRNDPTKTPDLTATILDLAGAEAPRRADGLSLVPSFAADRGWTAPVVTEAIVGDPANPPDTLEQQIGFTDARNNIGIRTARYKLIRDASGAVELYDLDADPNELDSVADDPEYSAILRELTRLWHRYKDCAGAECSVPLPPSLARSPTQTTASTNAQSEGVLARHGHTF